MVKGPGTRRAPLCRPAQVAAPRSASEIGIRVMPTTNHRTAEGSDQPVVIENTGSGQLRTFDLGFDGNAAEPSMAATSASSARSIAGHRARFAGTFTPTLDQGTVSARLVIHQNRRVQRSRSCGR
jgi:hypothetical protein